MCTFSGLVLASETLVSQFFVSSQGKEYRHTFLYNVSGKIQLETKYVQAADASWERDSQTEWYYEGEHCVKQIQRVFKNGKWKNTAEVETVYNRVNDMTDEYVFQYDDNGVRVPVKHSKVSFLDKNVQRDEFLYEDGRERLCLSNVFSYDGDDVAGVSMQVYDESGNAAAVYTLNYVYDALGRLSGCRVDDAGLPLDSTTWFYDAEGRIISERVKKWNVKNSSWENGQSTEYKYTPEGQLQSETYLCWGGMAWENVCRYEYSYADGVQYKRSLQTQLYREWRDLMSIHYSDFVSDNATVIKSEYDFWGGAAGESVHSYIPFMFNGEVMIREAESIRLEYDNWPSDVTVPEAESPLIKVYPNPSDGVFYLNTEMHEILSWSVYDPKGQMMKSEVLNYHTGVIDITELERGVYVLRVETTAGVQQQKLIKE